MATAIIFAACVCSVLIERILMVPETPNAFIHQLMRDSKLVDAQWTWREIYPGRDTMDYAQRLLQKGDHGFFQDITAGLYQSHIDWTTKNTPAWKGSIFSDNDLPPPHVYAIVIVPPQGDLTIADALLMYGLPLSAPISNLDPRNLCFSQGVCISFSLDTSSGRLSPYANVQSITYITSRVIKHNLSLVGWHGFRRYS